MVRSGKSKEETSSISQFHIPLRASTDGQSAANSTDSTGGLHLGNMGGHPLKSKYLERISHRKVEVQPVHSQTIPRSLEVQGDAGDPALGWGGDRHPAPRTTVLSRAVCKIN